ncbi:meiotic recombination protein Mre11 [Corchorus capsularis]|uniref:Meiotic recombination protein Mre11 n=1 Tax=Corchorus capsularis TaxID=210143 RepID=A0A1R3HQL1_COCAP|nr:meiotic recombination protein Mre11 [Corchorus capsularis]
MFFHVSGPTGSLLRFYVPSVHGDDIDGHVIKYQLQATFVVVPLPMAMPQDAIVESNVHNNANYILYMYQSHHTPHFYFPHHPPQNLPQPLQIQNPPPMENNPPVALQENPFQEDDADLAMEAEDRAPPQEVQGQDDDDEDVAMEVEDDDNEDIDEFVAQLENIYRRGKKRVLLSFRALKGKKKEKPGQDFDDIDFDVDIDDFPALLENILEVEGAGEEEEEDRG